MVNALALVPRIVRDFEIYHENFQDLQQLMLNIAEGLKWAKYYGLQLNGSSNSRKDCLNGFVLELRCILAILLLRLILLPAIFSNFLRQPYAFTNYRQSIEIRGTV